MKFITWINETYDKIAVAKYCIRWQLSTPIFIVIGLLLASSIPYWLIIIISNIIGALIFFPVDKWIMENKK